MLRKLAVLLSSHGLAKQPDMLLPLMDTLGEAARSSCATGVLLSTLCILSINSTLRCWMLPDI